MSGTIATQVPDAGAKGMIMKRCLAVLVLAAGTTMAGMTGLSATASAATASGEPMKGHDHHCCCEHNVNKNININING
ncbi:hypothetical protein GCM10023088_29200 [Actinomadura verrucosospora]